MINQSKILEIEEQKNILRNLRLNMQNLQDRIQYHEDQLAWLQEQNK